MTDQDDAPDNGDWLSEFPAEAEHAATEADELPAPASARAATREPLWTVIAHESGPAWPAPPDALAPPVSSRPSAFTRLWIPAAAWLRARPVRQRAIAAASVGVVALAGVIAVALTRGESAAPADAAIAPAATTSAAPPSATPTDTDTSTSALPPAPPAISTRDRASLDRPVTTPPPATTTASVAKTPPAPARQSQNNPAGIAAPPRRDIAKPLPTPSATPAPPPPAAAVTTTLGTATTLPAGQSIVSSPPPPPRPTPTPTPVATRPDAATANAPVAPPPAAPARPSESSLVQSVLDRYRQGYNALNADAVAAAWPSVNSRSLARAFEQLESQRFDFSNCRIDVAGTQAEARCAGTASFVPKVGDRTRRSESRQWTFSLVRVNDGWIIRRVESR